MDFLPYVLGVMFMTVRTITDQQTTLQFSGYKLDDADAWLELLKENGRPTRGELAKS